MNRGSFLDWSHVKELTPNLSVPAEKFAQRFDVLVNSLGEGTLGRVHFYNGPSAVFAVDQHMSICRFENPSRALYAYLYLSSQGSQAHIEALKTGSTGMTMLNISKLRGMMLTQPSPDLMVRFGSIALPLYDRVEYTAVESDTLTSVRDTLLPKLISGELRVPDAETLLAESPV